jgi:hypothetical protein
MKLAMRIIGGLLVLAIGWWLYTVLFPSPEIVIRKRLAKIAELASFDGKEGNIARIANVSQLVDYFALAVEVQVDAPMQAQHTFNGKDEIRQALLAVRSNLRGLDVQFIDPQIRVGESRSEAEVLLTAIAQIPGDRDQFPQELTIRFEKKERHWLITRIETVRTLK